MALTPSTMVPLGTPLPALDAPGLLRDLHGAPAALPGPEDAVLVVVFWANHCPYVRHIAPAFSAWAREAEGVAVVTIHSNDPAANPGDGPDATAAEARQRGDTFTHLVDPTQAVARAFGAVCTPDVFVYGPAQYPPTAAGESSAAKAGPRALAYRGQLDASRPGNGLPVTLADLRAAVTALQRGQAPSDAQAPATGCNIKWRPGAAPPPASLLR